jgi:trans-AT polyketide synthase/acyltransferase/oxidoreductase domain-containing protein
VHGPARGADGSIQRQNYVFAKISRPETARRFMMPAPKEMLDALVGKGQLTREEAELAALVPVAEDVTVEADSGGHTDNQTLTAVFPVIMRCATSSRASTATPGPSAWVRRAASARPRPSRRPSRSARPMCSPAR